MLTALSLMAAFVASGCAPEARDPPAGRQSQGSPGSGSGAGSGPSIHCAWPHDQPGVEEGMTLPESLRWDGFPEGEESTATSIGVESLYDCDGSRGIHAVAVINAQYNCSGCYQEAGELQAKMEMRWLPMGIKVLTLIVDGPQDGSVAVEDARVWRDTFELEDVAVAIDPDISMVTGDEVITPFIMVIDPRTMRVVWLHEGFPGPDDVIEDLATVNAGS
jgi:hypothetical protein